MFGEEETLGINGKGGIHSTVSWFQGVDGGNFKICGVKKIKQLAKQLQY